MAKKTGSINVQVAIEVNEEAVTRLQEAQARFNAALQEFQSAISDVQMATYGLQDSLTATESVETEPTT